MTEVSIVELRKEMEKVRGRLHAVVQGDTNLLLDQEAYKISVELDNLIVRLMKKEKIEREA
ncbi:MAG: aspartyl-phosphate phosphatase Spo0E family protein [Bacillota bacterium]